MLIKNVYTCTNVTFRYENVTEHIISKVVLLFLAISIR